MWITTSGLGYSPGMTKVAHGVELQVQESLPASRLRIEIPGVVGHVGIVRDDEDRHEWFPLFNRVDTRCG